MIRIKRAHVLLAVLAAALCVPAAGVSAGSGLPTTIGKGEGQLNLVAWEGYTQPQWVKPFTKATGCKVNAKYAGSSDEMVTLMRSGGGSQYEQPYRQPSPQTARRTGAPTDDTGKFVAAILGSADVVRHRLVSNIVDAYARWDAQQNQQSQQGMHAVPGRPPSGRAVRRR